MRYILLFYFILFYFFGGELGFYPPSKVMRIKKQRWIWGGNRGLKAFLKMNSFNGGGMPGLSRPVNSGGG
jgi:hypothetical protein